MLPRRTDALEQIWDRCVLAEDVAVADAKHPSASIAVPVFVLMEEEGDAALGIVVLPLRRGDGHAESGRQEPTDVVGRVGALGDAQKSRAGQLS